MSSPLTTPDLQKVRELVEEVPFNSLLGIQVINVEKGKAKCKLNSRPEVCNHVGTMHAGAQYSLIEAASGAALIGSLIDLLDQATPLVIGVDIAYRSSAYGDCTAEATIDDEDVERAKMELSTLRKSRID